MSTVAEQRQSGWTDEQRRAVESRGIAVALSAGAGCGKTFVLTERFLHDFGCDQPDALDPDDLYRLVAITFTERAAREMRDRVRKACYQRLIDAPPEEAKYWAELVRGLDTARISTIHSYCAALLRSHAVEAGIDPQFEVLEQAQSETLLSEVLDNELRRLVAQRDRATIELAARFDLYVLRNLLRVFVLEGREDDIERWLAADPSEQLARWAEFHREAVLPAIVRRVAETAESLLSILREHAPDRPIMHQRREGLIDGLGRLATVGQDCARLAAELGTLREHAKVQGGGTARQWGSQTAYESYKNAAAGFRELVDELVPLVQFDPAGAEEAALVGQELLTIADGVRRRYAERKQELAAMDFDDLLARARKLLVDPTHAGLRRRLSEQVRLLLVDEFQDTDAVQVELVEALCGNDVSSGKLFYVGDLKQSIYRFRGAEPDVFRRLRERTLEAGRLSLTENFRSQPAILHFVNALFWHDLGGDYEPLRPHRRQLTATPAVEFLWAEAAATTPKKGEKRAAALKDDVRAIREREARWIAARIRQIVDSGDAIVTEKDPQNPGQYRKRAAQKGDIAILFRALSDIELYEHALRQQEIDYYLVGGHAFYAQQEIFDLLNLLRAVASAADGVSLAGALRSGFFALADETIFWLAMHRDGLEGGLMAPDWPAEIEPAQRERVAFAAATLRQLRASKDRLRVCELIELAMSLSGYDAILLAEFLGERKLANLRKVIEQARRFERSGFGLADFIAQLAEFVARQPKEPLAATFSEDTDVVRLMTIHQAKGLEFPIVIVPDVDRPQRFEDEPARFHRELGPLVQLPKDGDGRRAVGGHELWRFAEQDEERAEMLRLLYVATTRAADYLILSRGVPHSGQCSSVWMDLLAKRFDLATGDLKGDMPAGEPRPRVRVTTTAPDVPARSGSAHATSNLDKAVAEVRAARADVSPVAGMVEPVVPDASARRQYSFSRLTGNLFRPYQPADDAAPRETGRVDPRGLGTLVHAVLAAIDFRQPGNWREVVRLHAERQMLEGSLDEASSLVERFLASPRARELAAAKQLLPEAEFLLAWPPDGSSEAPLILTGYIDLLYQDAAGRWHVVDFKTNRVAAGDVAKAASVYEMQMLVYGLAAERILGTAPLSLTLHFLRIGAEHAFSWDEQARTRVRTLVDKAIAAATATPAVVP